MASNFFDQFDSAPAQDAAPQQNPYAGAISSIESSGRYDLVGPKTRTGDRALGKYQVMSANVPEWTKEALGQSLSPQQFLADPKAQDAVFQHQFGKYVQKYGPEGAARAWFAGEGGMNDPTRRDVLGTSVADYSNKFTKALGFAPQQQAPQGLPPVIANGQSAQPKNFFDQFDEQPSTVQRADVPAGVTRVTVTPSVADRSQVGPPPENSDALRSGLVNLGAQRTQGEPTDNFGKLLIDFQNQGAAAGQRTTPNISAQQPNLLSTDVQEGDDGNAYFVDPQNGSLHQVDTAKHVVLRDPADGRLKVYGRTDNTNEGMLSSAGRLLGTGLAAGAPVSRAVAPAAQVAQEIRPGQQVVAAANRLSQTGGPVQVPRAVATDNMATQQVAAAASNVPVAGTPLVKAAENTISQLGTKADEVAKGFGGAASPQEAGDTARSAIKNWITGESANNATKLYNRVDTLVDQNVKTPLAATQKAVAEIAAKRSSAALSSGKATDAVLGAVQRADGLTYEGVKTLRTNIGEMLKGGILPEGMSGSELEKIYGALTTDLKSSIRAAGGAKAEAAFNRANEYYRLASERRAQLAKIIGSDGNAPAETVLNRIEAMAGSSSRADISKLMQARKAIGSEDWNEIASTVVTRLGRDVEGNFTPQRFVTAYGKLSPAGKSILFRSGGKTDLANHLDDIAKVSSRFKELQKFANPSGTARAGLGGLIGASAFAEPLTTLSSVLGGRVLATILSRPASAASVAKVVKAQEALVLSPSPARLSAFNTATRNLISTIGARNLTPADFLKAVQGTVQSRAQDEQQ